MLSWKEKNKYDVPFHEFKCPQPPSDIIANKNAFKENNTEETEEIFEILVFNSTLTRLIVREDFTRSERSRV
jgi:hypothetical protein